MNETITLLEKYKDSELLSNVIGINDNPEKICKSNLMLYLNKDIETINRAIEEIIKEIKHINILILGQNNSDIAKLTTMKAKGKNESPIFLGNNDNNNNCDDNSYLRF